MDVNRSRYGLLVSALGAIVLAVSVFLPWYGMSFTASGIAFAQRIGDQVASQFGNAALQGRVAGLHTDLSGLAGHQFVAMSAHQSLKHLNVVLLILAGMAIVVSLVPLARSEPLLRGGGDGTLLTLIGALAAACVLYRMIEPPNIAGGFVTLSLREGAWLALLGSLAMVVGVVWPRGLNLSAAPGQTGGSVWSELSGWTPEG
jgi:hypothetical protein